MNTNTETGILSLLYLLSWADIIIDPRQRFKSNGTMFEYPLYTVNDFSFASILLASRNDGTLSRTSLSQQLSQ